MRRALAALGIMGAEYLLATLAFDAERLPPMLGTDALRHLGGLVPIVVVVGAGTCLFGGRRLGADVRRVLAEHPRERKLFFVLVHAFFYLCAVAVAALAFGSGAQVRHGVAWTAAWLVSTALSVALLPLCVTTRAGLVGLARAALPALAGGTALGLVTLAVGAMWRTGWDPLSSATLTSASAVLRAWGAEVVVDPDSGILGTPAYQVHIAAQCSGLEGIGLVSSFVGFHLYRARSSLRFPRALVLLPLGAVAVWVGNVLRIAVLIWLGSNVSPAAAEGGFHSGAGWLLSTTLTLLLIALATRSGAFARQAEPLAAAWTSPTAAYLVPLLALLALGQVAGLFTFTFDVLYPLQIVGAGLVLWAYRGTYGKLFSRPDVETLGYGLLGYLIWIAIAPVTGPDPSSPAARTLASAPMLGALVWIAFRVAGSSLVVPFAEELAFRGYLLRRLTATEFDRASLTRLAWMPLAVSSLVFGAMHEHWVAATLVGVVYACAQARRGRVGDAIWAHGTSNALIAVDVLALGNWHHW